MMDLESRLSLVEHPFGISMEEEWTSACMEPVSSRRCPVLTLVRAGRDRVAVPNLDFPPFLVFLHPRCSFPDVAQCRNAGAAILLLVFDVPYVRQFIALVLLVRELAQALLHPPSQGL